MGKGLIMTQADYRSADGLSSTDIKRMAKSMAHFKYFQDNPDDKDTPALKFGRAYHKYCLEPSDFHNNFIVAPNIDRRTKQGKQEYADFVAEAKDKEIITEETLEKLEAMRKALYSTPFAKKLIYGEHEKSFFWEDKNSGFKCKCRPDSFGEIGGQPICVDLKTCTDAETDKFMRHAINLNYDIQASHYCDGLKANTGKDFLFVFIAQEKEPPYAVNILQADEYFMKSGHDVRASLLRDYKECLERGEFPSFMGFSENACINSLGLPEWLKKANNYVEEEDMDDGNY